MRREYSRPEGAARRTWSCAIDSADNCCAFAFTETPHPAGRAGETRPKDFGARSCCHSRTTVPISGAGRRFHRDWKEGKMRHSTPRDAAAVARGPRGRQAMNNNADCGCGNDVLIDCHPAPRPLPLYQTYVALHTSRCLWGCTYLSGLISLIANVVVLPKTGRSFCALAKRKTVFETS